MDKSVLELCQESMDKSVLLPAEAGVRGATVVLDTFFTKISVPPAMRDQISTLAEGHFEELSLPADVSGIIASMYRSLVKSHGAQYKVSFSPYLRTMTRKDAVESWTSHTLELYNSRRGERAGVSFQDFRNMLKALNLAHSKKHVPTPAGAVGVLFSFDVIRPLIGLVPSPHDAWTLVAALLVEDSSVLAERRAAQRQRKWSLPEVLCRAPRSAGLPPGIVNVGSSCHTSSLLQALNATRHVRRAALAFDPELARVARLGLRRDTGAGAGAGLCEVGQKIAALDSRLVALRSDGLGPEIVTDGQGEALLVERDAIRAEGRRRDADIRVAASLRQVFRSLSASDRVAIDANAPCGAYAVGAATSTADGGDTPHTHTHPGGLLYVRVKYGPGPCGSDGGLWDAPTKRIYGRVAGVYAVERYYRADRPNRAMPIYRKVRSGLAVPSDGMRCQDAAIVGEETETTSESGGDDDDMLFSCPMRCGAGGCWHHTWILAPRWRMDSLLDKLERGESLTTLEVNGGKSAAEIARGKFELEDMYTKPLISKFGHPGYNLDPSIPCPFPWETCGARRTEDVVDLAGRTRRKGSLLNGWTALNEEIVECAERGAAVLEVQRADVGFLDELCALSGGDLQLGVTADPTEVLDQLCRAVHSLGSPGERTTAYFAATLRRLNFPLEQVDEHMAFLQRIVDVPYLPQDCVLDHHMLAVVDTAAANTSRVSAWGPYVLHLRERNRFQATWACGCKDGKGNVCGTECFAIDREVFQESATRRMCEGCGHTVTPGAIAAMPKKRLIVKASIDQKSQGGLMQFLRNIVENPMEKKFRKLRTTKQLAKDLEASWPLFLGLGFERRAMKKGDTFVLDIPSTEDLVAAQVAELQLCIDALASHAFDLHLAAQRNCDDDVGERRASTQGAARRSNSDCVTEWLRELDFKPATAEVCAEVNAQMMGVNVYSLRHCIPTAPSRPTSSQSVPSGILRSASDGGEEEDGGGDGGGAGAGGVAQLQLAKRAQLRDAIEALQRYRDEASCSETTDTIADFAKELRETLPAVFSESFQRKLPYFTLLPPEYGALEPPHSRLLREEVVAGGSVFAPRDQIGGGDNLYAALTRCPIAVNSAAPSFPPVLVFKIERPAGSASTFRFDTSIHLHSPYVVMQERDAADAAAAADGSSTSVEEWGESLALVVNQGDGSSTVLNDMHTAARRSIVDASREWGGEYVLRAVVVHKSTACHYTAFVRQVDDGSLWTEFDDDFVRPNLPLVEAQGVWFGGSYARGGDAMQARMLFYENVAACAVLDEGGAGEGAERDAGDLARIAADALLRRYSEQSALASGGTALPIVPGAAFKSNDS